MNRTLKDQLRIWKQEYQEVARKPQKRRREVLSESDIKDGQAGVSQIQRFF